MFKKVTLAAFALLFSVSCIGLNQVNAASEKLIQSAKKEGKVVLYHSLSRRVLKKLVKGFEKKYGIDVKWTRKGTGGIIRMVTAEKMAGALKCDIVSTGDPTVFIRWQKEGLLKKYISTNTSSFHKGLANPEGWITPSRTTIGSMGYNTKNVKDSEAPKSWKDVLDPKWKGRLAIVDPRKSGPARWWMAGMVKRFGWEYFQELAKNKPLLLKATSTAALALINGEADVLVIANEHDLVRRKAKGQSVSPSYPKEGISKKTSPVAICANPPNPNAAKLWIDWESSAKMQALMTKDGGYPPTRTDVKSYHPRDPKLTAPDNLLDFSQKKFIKNKRKMLKKFGKIMKGMKVRIYKKKKKKKKK